MDLSLLPLVDATWDANRHWRVDDLSVLTNEKLERGALWPMRGEYSRVSHVSDAGVPVISGRRENHFRSCRAPDNGPLVGRWTVYMHTHKRENCYTMYIVLDCSSMSTNKILSMYRVCAFDWSINHSIFLLLFSLYPGGSCQTIIADIPRILDWPRLTGARRHNDSDSDTSVKCFITLCLINILGMSSANLTQSDVSSVKRAFMNMIKQNIATVKNRYLFICQKMLERQSLDIYQWLWQADTQWHAMTGRWWLSMLVPDHIRALSPAGSHAPWANSLRGFERSSRSANMCLESLSGFLAVFKKSSKSLQKQS